MKVSVVLSVYNVKLYLERCVQSVLNQTYKDFEIVLVDDGSTDGSGELCDQLAKSDSRVVVVHQKNQGNSGARNTGIRHAKGDYIIFADSDDYWLLNDGLMTLIQNCDEGTDLICFKEVDIWKDERKTYNLYNLKEISRQSNAQELFSYLVRTQQLRMAVWITMVRRQILLDHELYFRLRLMGEDFYWHFCLWQHVHKVKMLNLCLYGYCRREGSITTATVSLRPYRDYGTIFTYWKEQYQLGCVNGEATLAYLANIWINRGYVFYKLKAADKPEAFAILRKHVDLLDHAATPKAKRTVKILHFVGLRATVFLLGLYWRMRSWIKGNVV
jgi:glycosyltransferase involved in cell wall biosynthesis